MSEEGKYDLVVIGGGPAGYAGAIRAGQLGKKVACIEFERAGGTCLNWGCIPSKALLKAAELYTDIHSAESFGFSVGEVGVDFGKVMQRSREVSDRMGGGVEFLFKKNKVDYFLGRGHVSVPGIVEITEGPDMGRVFSTRNVIVCTGCKARIIPDLEVDGERVMTSREALALKRMPKSVAILGAGAIGVEFAYFLNTLGCEVTLIEMLPQVLPVEDRELSNVVARSFKKQGIAVHVDAVVEEIKTTRRSVSMVLVKGEERLPLKTDALLLAIGVVANTDGLFSPKVKPSVESGFIVVNERYETSVRGIYAAGDLIGPPWLAHVATYEAIEAVNGIFGVGEPGSVRVFPSCTYCQPQVASVGLTEEAAKEKGLNYRVGKFPFSANGKAVAVSHTEGLVKLIVEKDYGEILGAHIVGSDATELIAEYVLAMKAELTADDIHGTIHAHPTLSEALGEAAAAAYGEAIHI